MNIIRVSRAGALESVPEVVKTAPNAEGTVNGKPGRLPSELPPGTPRPAPPELYVASKAYLPRADGMRETYAKIRYDGNTNMVLIQIVNAANEEVITEIPPGAWVKLRQGLALPKGMIVEAER